MTKLGPVELTTRDRFEHEAMRQLKEAIPTTDTSPGSLWTRMALDLARGMALLDSLLKELNLTEAQQLQAEEAMKHLSGVPVRVAVRLLRWMPPRR